MVAEELPELDADEPGGLEADASWLSTDALRDEDLPSRAERAWEVARVEVMGGDLECVATSATRIWAAGTRLAWLGRDGSHGAFELRQRAFALVPLADGALTLTASSLEVWDLAGNLRQTSDPRAPLGVCASESAELELSAWPEAGDSACVVSAKTHRVATRDTPEGAFRALELGGKVCRLSRGRPTLALVRGAEGFALVRLGDQASELSRVPVDATAEEVLSGESPMLASAGDVVAVGSVDRGLAISTDCGRTFSRVPGCLHATDLSAAERAGRVRVWASVFIESEERSLILEVDTTTGVASLVAELLIQDELSLADGEDARVEELAWDALSGRLLAATRAGLYLIAPPGYGA